LSAWYILRPAARLKIMADIYATIFVLVILAIVHVWLRKN